MLMRARACVCLSLCVLVCVCGGGGDSGYCDTPASTRPPVSPKVPQSSKTNLVCYWDNGSHLPIQSPEDVQNGLVAELASFVPPSSMVCLATSNLPTKITWEGALEGITGRWHHNVYMMWDMYYRLLLMWKSVDFCLEKFNIQTNTDISSYPSHSRSVRGVWTGLFYKVQFAILILMH